MNKTYNINLSGQVFCIDEDACTLLQNYIHTLEKYYLREEGGREIMADIESRIAELLTGFLQRRHKQVTGTQEINEVIQIMGSPDEIIEEDKENNPQIKIKRKFYRSADYCILGGVAAGIATYFSVSIVLVRILFILSAWFYGVTVLAYIILWVVTPRALTARQKLEMKGERINVSNIEKNIRDTYNNIKKKSEPHLKDHSETSSRFFNGLGRIADKTVAVLLSILSVFGLVCGTFLFALVIWLLFIPLPTPWEDEYKTLFSIFTPSCIYLAKIILLLVINIPLLLIVYSSICYLFNFKWHKTLLIVALILWLLSCFVGVFTGISQALGFSDSLGNTNQYTLAAPGGKSHKLHLQINHLPEQQTGSTLQFINSNILNTLAADTAAVPTIYMETDFRIRSHSGSSPSLRIYKRTRSSSSQEGRRNLENMCLQWKYANDTLTLDNYFSVRNSKWKAQEIRVTLYIPKGDTLTLSGLQLRDIDNPSVFKNFRYHSLQEDDFVPEYTYVMKNNHLINIKNR